MGNIIQDLRHAFRILRRSAGFTSVSVLTLALAIGATTAIFSVVYGVLRPLPYSDPDRLMAIFEVSTRGTWSRLADPNFDDFRDQNHTFQSIAKYSNYVVSISGGSQPTRTMMASVTPQFLKIFRVQPMIGRDFLPSDAKKGAAPVALVSYGYWKQYLGSPSNLLPVASESRQRDLLAHWRSSRKLPISRRYWRLGLRRSRGRKSQPHFAQLQRRRTASGWGNCAASEC